MSKIKLIMDYETTQASGVNTGDELPFEDLGKSITLTAGHNFSKRGNNFSSA